MGGSESVGKKVKAKRRVRLGGRWNIQVNFDAYAQASHLAKWVVALQTGDA
jgi:hypothetical protein